MQNVLRKSVGNLEPNDYMEAKRYVRELDNTIKILRDPNVKNYVTQKWSPKGANNVTQLVADMSRQGLRFAPAVPGDEGAYVALHGGMVANYVWPSQQQLRAEVR
jgi:hypothetical protein